MTTLAGTELINVYGADYIGGLDLGIQYKVPASQLSGPAPTPTSANVAVTATTGSTLTAANLLTRMVTRSGPTANFSDATDTAVNIIAALPPNTAFGMAFYVDVQNNTIYQQTITPGTGVTFSGLTSGSNFIIPANSTASYILNYTAAGAVTLFCMDVAYNATNGYDPSSVATQFGSGTATFLEEGNIFKYVSGTGISPGATGADNVLAVFSVPANSLDGISNRGLAITAVGSVANNTNAKRMKIYFNATTAVVGSTVTGGTVIADTGSYTTTGAAGWQINAQVFKYGVAGSNTQLAMHESTQIGATVSSLVTPQALTATESGVILIAITGNATTATTDIVMNFAQINAMN